MKQIIYYFKIFCLLIILAVFSFGQAKFTESKNGMAATGSTYATDAAVKIMASGGNAVDAAAAACLVLMVTDPSNTSLGGRAQILIRLSDGRVIAIDGATESPSIVPALTNDKDDRSGYQITPVPGALAALEQMVGKYGKLKFSKVLEPAIELAEKGFIVPPRLAASWERTREVLAKNPGARQNFLKADGSAYKAGEIFIQKNLANTLKQIAKSGTKVFYRGRIAKIISRDIKQNGGFIGKMDLKNYRAQPGKAVYTDYRGYKVVSAGGRAWGNTLAELLNILENFEIKPDEPNALELEILARTIAQAMEDRPQEIGTLKPKESGFSLEQISTKEFAKQRAELIKQKLGEEFSQNLQKVGQSKDEPHDTTHLSVMDTEGNAVSLTTSIGPAFGARVATPELGFLYAHSYKMRSAPTPNTRDLTEMTPTIVFRNNQAFLIIGGAGSERIPTAVFQVISNMIDRNWSLEKAMTAPRIFSLGNKLRMQSSFSENLIEKLRTRGFEIEIVEENAARHNGLVHAVQYDSASKTFFGAADFGDSGSSAGL
ncbi:gamma-glutamyltransferase [soil metagenome]